MAPKSLRERTAEKSLRERAAELENLRHEAELTGATHQIRLDVQSIPSEDVLEAELTDITEKMPEASKLLQNGIIRRRFKLGTIGSITVYIDADGKAHMLITKPKRAKDETSMEVDTQHIIEQAQAEQARQPEAVAHLEPDTLDELATIALEANQLSDTVAKLRELDLPVTSPEAEVAIAGLHAIAQRSNKTAWQLGLHAVEQGLISQTRLAELLDSSSATVSRRYREEPQEAKEQ